eukprot:TRINITY_DN5973_c0_g1_i2.p1 TRINITY_DN5973_c0_g1~~TRINITY_DN5973_c0_g1_i2.p1  ORF type:complete len:346 (+),score=117.86 TRINITY_DN5973_c0_g1_i2:61-1098(+)
MPGLRELSKMQVANMVAHTKAKYSSTDEFLSVFTPTLQVFYDSRDCNWNDSAARSALREYRRKTDAVKDQAVAECKTNIVTGAASAVGGILMLTPLQPVGMALMGAGALTSLVSHTLRDNRPQDEWVHARDQLMRHMNGQMPFGELYTALVEGRDRSRRSIAADDYIVLLQAFGWCYFNARDAGLGHKDAVARLARVSEFLEKEKYVITQELREGQLDAVSAVECLVANRFGASTSLVTGVLCAIEEISNAAPNLFHLVHTQVTQHLGNLLKEVSSSVMATTVVPVIIVIGGTSLVLHSAMKWYNIENKFREAYAFADTCEEGIANRKEVFDVIKQLLDSMKSAP